MSRPPEPEGFNHAQRGTARRGSARDGLDLGRIGHRTEDTQRRMRGETTHLLSTAALHVAGKAQLATRGVFEVARDGFEELTEQEDEEGRAKGRRCPERQERIVPADRLEDQERWDHCDLRRDHHGGEHDDKAQVAPGPAQPGESVGGQRGGERAPGSQQQTGRPEKGSGGSGKIALINQSFIQSIIPSFLTT